ncbi:MAG: HAD family hydrolase [Anaerolineales bacterium]|nr:HAD family hydrolase [Anaerolineales bacterium]
MSINFDRIQALCFDLDGTLRDTDDQFVQRLARLLGLFKSFLPNRDSLPLARKIVMATESPANFLFRMPDHFGLDDELSRLGDFIYSLGIGQNPDPFRPVEGVVEMLKHLQTRYPMAIVSARGARSTMAFLDYYNLTPCFTCIATNQTCAHTKPYPDPVLWAAQRMETPPQACLMIGDTIVDIQAGKAAGAQTIGVLCGFGERDELQRQGADLILDSTPDMLEALG